MAITRAKIQAALLRRCANKLTYARLDGTTVDVPNVDLNDPIAEGLASLGIAPADFAAVADADLAALDPLGVPQLLDVAELRCLESVLGNRATPDQKVLDASSFDGRFYQHLEETVYRVRKQVERQYGIGVATLGSGVLDLGFQATTDPATGLPD